MATKSIEEIRSNSPAPTAVSLGHQIGNPVCTPAFSGS